MPHLYHHAGCEHEHSHEEPGGAILFSRVHRDAVEALNEAAPGSGKLVIKPWDNRLDESQYLESDADEQLILRVPFTGSVKLKALIIKGSNSSEGPSEVRLFPNIALDFDDVSGREPVQTIELVATREPVEYVVKTAKLSAVRSLSLFFPRNHAGTDVTRVDFVGFKGGFTEIRDEAIVTVYEAQANPADHVKLPGLDQANMSSPG